MQKLNNKKKVVILANELILKQMQNIELSDLEEEQIKGTETPG